MLDKRLSYKMITVIKRLSVNLPCDALLKIYKSFIRPHLNYGDIIYDKTNKESFKNKVEKIQYKACFAITGAIQGTSREHLYHELEIEDGAANLHLFIKLSMDLLQSTLLII